MSRLAHAPIGRPRRGLAILSLVGVLTACGTSASGAPPKASPTQRVDVAMGYFPSIQFAPFYVALSRGYYRRAGLELHIHYGIEPDVLRLASTGKADFVNAGGDEVLAAAVRGLHVRYIMTQYSRFPSALFALQSSGIRRPRDLRGHSIGIPGAYGASYVGLLAFLRAVGLSTSAVKIRNIGFTQPASVAHHKVDAAVGFATNEPIQLRRQGLAIREWDFYRWANIAGAGLATSDSEIQRRPGVVRAFVRATLHGLSDTIADPAAAYRISVARVKEIGTQPALQKQILKRAIDFWRAEPGHPLGWVDPTVWQRTARLLYTFKQIPHQVAPSSYYTERFIPASGKG